jgi:hypothetical protein
LDTPAGLSAVTQISALEALQSRIRVLTDYEVCRLERRADTLPEAGVPAAKKYALAIFIAMFSMNRKHDLGFGYERYAHGLVEPSTGDVQV